MTPICFLCEFCKGHYRSKPDIMGGGGLVIYRCENEAAIKASPSNPSRMIRVVKADMLWELWDKIKTSPKWCPLRGKRNMGEK